MIKRNNPGNIRPGNAPWRGVIGESNNFVEFVDLPHGIRAMIINLHTYMFTHKLRTIRSIVTRWAPPSENDTNNYINFISKRMNIEPDARLAWYRSVVLKLVAAMTKMEHRTELAPNDLEAGWVLVPAAKRKSSY
jgi:hypothetical protein